MPNTMFWLEASSRVTVGKIDEGDFAYGKRKPSHPWLETSTHKHKDFQTLARLEAICKVLASIQNTFPSFIRALRVGRNLLCLRHFSLHLHI
ncbi:MAG: hypothetical protein Q4E41_06590 [Bacteroidales bacterium]|nr:hypothetical protein [Bacteroidales bacterium]